jgi:hypothetical protein
VKRGISWLLAAILLAAVTGDAHAGKGGYRGGSRSSPSRTFRSSPGTGSRSSSVHVRGYTRSNGTVVQPHRRSAADGRFSNNWTTRGNVNPYTGRAGSRVTPRR